MTVTAHQAGGEHHSTPANPAISGGAKNVALRRPRSSLRELCGKYSRVDLWMVFSKVRRVSTCPTRKKCSPRGEARAGAARAVRLSPRWGAGGAGAAAFRCRADRRAGTAQDPAPGVRPDARRDHELPRRRPVGRRRAPVRGGEGEPRSPPFLRGAAADSGRIDKCLTPKRFCRKIGPACPACRPARIGRRTLSERALLAAFAAAGTRVCLRERDLTAALVRHRASKPAFPLNFPSRPAELRRVARERGWRASLDDLRDRLRRDARRSGRRRLDQGSTAGQLRDFGLPRRAGQRGPRPRRRVWTSLHGRRRLDLSPKSSADARRAVKLQTLLNA